MESILSVSTLINIAIVSFFLTFLVMAISNSFKKANAVPTEVNYNQLEVEKILEKCYELFPKDKLRFKENVYKRGMYIKIKTIQNRSYEGRFIGINNQEMVCIITKTYVRAYDIDNIEAIELIGSKD